MRPPATVTHPQSLSPLLYEALMDLAAAVQRRAIYPAGHPVLRGAVTGVWQKVSACLVEHETVELGVGGRRLVSAEGESDPSHPLLGDLAARLSAHRVGGLRIRAGVSEDELARLVDGIAAPPDGDRKPLAQRDDVMWSRVHLEEVSFGRLGLLQDQGAADATSGGGVWRAMAASAFSVATGELVAPSTIVGALLESGEGGDALRSEFEAYLLALPGTARADGSLGEVLGMLDLLGVPGLQQVFAQLGPDRTNRLVHRASEVLPGAAVVDLVQAAAQANAKVVSSSMLRLLQKLGDGQRAHDPTRAGARLMQLAIRRLLHEWTLDSPNPIRYEEALGMFALPRERGTDAQRDHVEPERLVDIALEVGEAGPAADVALGRLAFRDGVAATIAALSVYPPTPARERLIDRLLNEATLREQLAQPTLDMAFLRQAVDRIHHRAAVTILDALARRSDADATMLVDLLQRIGWDVLEPIGARIATEPPRVLRHLVTLFDALDAWPPQVDPVAWMTHPDFLVRRETIKYQLKGSLTREGATLAALRDPDIRLVAVGLHAIAGTCPPAAAREVMRRYADPGLTTELRVRAIRAASSCQTTEVVHWLVSVVHRRRRWFRRSGLQKPSPESVAAIMALAQSFPGHPSATEILRLARESRSSDYRRAVTNQAESAHA
jgi:hypothetical protein